MMNTNNELSAYITENSEQFKPSITNATALTSCSIFLSWTVKKLKEGLDTIDHFVVELQSVEDHKTLNNQVNVTKDRLDYNQTFYGVDPLTNYSVVVSSFLKGDESYGSDPVLCLTPHSGKNRTNYCFHRIN